MPDLLPSVAQPPLPLQEFLALQPLSPVLQPPCPLHSFCPLHPCLPFASSICWSATPALLLAVVVAAYARTANDPVRRPATAAPAIIALDGLIIFCLFFVFVRLRDGTVVFWEKLQTTDLLFVRASALLGCTNRILIPRLAKMAPNSKFFDQLAQKSHPGLKDKRHVGEASSLCTATSVRTSHGAREMRVSFQPVSAKSPATPGC